MKVKVLNIRSGEPGIYIGRACRGHVGSPLGNPFKMHGEADRERVINAYRHWLWDQIRNTPNPAHTELVRIFDLASEYGEVSLLCWCAPRPCHGDVIKAALEWMETQS